MAKSFVVALAAFLWIATAIQINAQHTPDIVWKRLVHPDHIHAVVYAKSQGYLVSAGGDRLIKFWRLSDGAVLRTLNQDIPQIYDNGIETLALSPDATRLASGSGSNLSLWQLPSGTRTIPQGPVGTVFATQFSPNGAFLVSGGDDGKVRVRRASDGAIIRTLNAHSGRVRSLAFSPDGRFLVSAAGDSLIKVWRTSDWGLLRTLAQHTAEVRSVVFNSAGTIMASAGEDAVIKLWRVSDWARIREFRGHAGIINLLAFSPDGNTLASSDNESIRMWRMSDGAVIRNYTSEVDGVGSVIFLDNSTFAYGRFDGGVIVARLSLPPPVFSGPPYTLLLQHNDGRLTEWFMNGNQRHGSAALRKGSAPATGWNVVGFGDLNGDDSSDILWQNGNTLSVWFMSGRSFISSRFLPKKPAAGWKAVGLADFTGDGQTDILFVDPQGRLAVWRMNGVAFVSSALIRNGQSIGSGYSVAGVGDFNKDNNTDILLRHSNGSFLVWYLRGTTFTSATPIRGGEPLPAGWKVGGIGDFDGNGSADLLCQYTDGTLRMWYPDKTNFAGSRRFALKVPAGTGWRTAACE